MNVEKIKVVNVYSIRNFKFQGFALGTSVVELGYFGIGNMKTTPQNGMRRYKQMHLCD